MAQDHFCDAALEIRQSGLWLTSELQLEASIHIYLKKKNLVYLPEEGLESWSDER